MKQPNLIYIFADRLCYSRLGFQGDPLSHTPRLDRIAEECVRMENCVSGHPTCASYRASLLTGKYTTSTGMVIDGLRLNPEHRTLAHVLKENGYATGYLGKWNLYADRRGHAYDPENSFVPAGPDRLGFEDVFEVYANTHGYFAPEAFYCADTPEKTDYADYEPDAQFARLAAITKELHGQEKPFALFLSVGTPCGSRTKDNVPAEYYRQFSDTAFPVPPNYSSKNDRHADYWARFQPGERRRLEEWEKVYYAMVANLDDNIGKLYDTLKANGILDETIFVFTSDHGELFGAHGRKGENIFYEEAVRVPFLIRCGAAFTPGVNRTGMNTVDIMPTLLSLMHLPVPEAAEGTDLSESILTGKEIRNSCLLMGTGPASVYGDGKEWRGLRDERYTYAVYKIDGAEFLFDNLSDPYQCRNLVKEPEYAAKHRAMKSEMYLKMKAIGDTFEKNSFYKKYWIKERRILPQLVRREDIR